ncbi:hypothetical protein [Plesiocystis pacifica]|nr:hypothetical protein [Plesiocystis pacifica]
MYDSSRARRLLAVASLSLVPLACDADPQPAGAKAKSDDAKVEAPAEVAEPEPEPEPAKPAPGLQPPPADFPKQAKDSIGWEELETVLNLPRGQGLTEAQVVAALGQPNERRAADPMFPVEGKPDAKEVTLSYEQGPGITLRASGGVQFTFSDFDEKLRELYPGDPAVSLIGQSCDEVARRVTFMDEVGSYTSCKHYGEGWFYDLTVMCRDTASSVVVVWEPLPPGMTPGKDHC